MIEAKIVLMMSIWPAGQMDDKPLWTNEIYLTVESCEKDAMVLKAKIAAKYGAATRTEHQCISVDDRVET
ncbi:MAG: hypothetical protein V7679_12855 [Parasphingorhabdus sp.]